jgi:hypothetical protein
MKRFLAFLVLLAMVSCAVPQAPPKAAPEPTAQPVQEVPPAEEAIADEPEPSSPPEDDLAERLAQEQAEKIAEQLETPPKLEPRQRTTIGQQMWDIYSGIDSYQFKALTGAWFVRGEKVKYIPYKAIRLRDITIQGKLYRDAYADEIIFDRNDMTATAYCTGHDENIRQPCANLDITDKPFLLPYEPNMIKLPDNWLKEYKDKQPTLEEYEKYYVKNVLTTKAVYSDGVELYFFPKAGIPLQVVEGPLRKTVYDDIVVNQVRPEDVIHRSRSEIPEGELYFRQKY